jgi:hypothetical protein
MKQPAIDFRFAKNWKAFLRWHDSYNKKNKSAPWSIQQLKIQQFFESDNPGIVNWKQLWQDFASWHKSVYDSKREVLWSEQKRQIETLMLEQLKELNQEHFVLVFLHKGQPTVDSQTMTYWEAYRVKQNLMGDKNGRGGNEDLDKITIVNLKSLIQ